MACICVQILRLEPYFEVQKPAHSQQSGVASEAGSAVAIGEKKVQDLTSLYGAMNRNCFFCTRTIVVFLELRLGYRTIQFSSIYLKKHHKVIYTSMSDACSFGCAHGSV
jgi:hypothetical protein